MKGMSHTGMSSALGYSTSTTCETPGGPCSWSYMIGNVCETSKWLGRVLEHITSASMAIEASGVVGVVMTGEGTFAMKSKGLPDLLALSDLWCEWERFDKGARNSGGALAMVARVCLVEGGMVW